MAPLNTVEFLATVPLCRGFSRQQLEVLASILTLQMVPPKAALFREGDPGDAFFLILEGQVGVYKQIPGVGLERLTILGAKEPVGHLCLIDGEARSATCVAESMTRVLRGDRRLFDRLFSAGDTLAFAFIDAIARDLCAKLRATNRRLHDLYARPNETVARLKELAMQVARATEQEAVRAELVRFDQEKVWGVKGPMRSKGR